MDQETNYLVNIRETEQKLLLSQIQPGTIIQVCGPPMVGKSTIIKQVINKDQRLKKECPNIFYEIVCKKLDRFQDVLTQVMIVLNNGHAQSRPISRREVLWNIETVTGHMTQNHHVFVFHKCEALRLPENERKFLKFICQIASLFWSHNLKVSVVFSTYKKFNISGNHTRCVDVDVLTDLLDIRHLLQHYAPSRASVDDLVYVCYSMLFLPEAVQKVSEKYLVQDNHLETLKGIDRQYPGSMEEILCWDGELMFHIFHHRVVEVQDWLTQQDLTLLVTLRRRTFNEGQLERCYRLLFPKNLTSDWLMLLNRLKDSYVIRELPGSDQLAVHPLVDYYIQNYRPGSRLYFEEKETYSSNNFLCHVTLKAEENQRMHGKGLLHGCHVRDWPLLRDLMQTAFQCRSYSHLLKAAVMGRNLIISCFPNNSKEFYEIMYNSTKIYGSPSQKAVMQICLAQAIASKKGADLPNALTYVESAIETLQCYGPNFFYRLALWKKAKLLEDLGDHCQALEYFRKAKEESHLLRLRVESDDILQVTELQMEEESLLAEIQETIPLIFSGKNVQAKEKLMMLYDTINDRYDNHPEFAAILNGIGLIIQRGTKDMSEAFKWYYISFKERLHTQNICPQNMVATMNNMAMILCRQGDPDAGEKYLRRSLAILEKICRKQYYTALTLTHLSEVKVKQGDYFEAYKVTIEAEQILRETSKNHDFRLKINMSLVHHILVLSHTNSSSCAVTSTVEDSVKCLIQLGSSVKQYLSDDGHHFLMSAYEHALLLNWRDSEDTYQLYRKDLLDHIQKHTLLRDVLLKKDASQFPSSLLKEHRHIVDYIRDTDYAQLDFLKLFSYLSEACPMCRNIVATPAEQLWRKEIEKLSYDRETFRNVLSPMPTSHESFEHLSLSVSEVSEQNVESGSQSCANQVEMSVMSPSVMQDPLHIHKVINPSEMPDHQDSFNGTNLSEMQGDKNSLKILNPSEMPDHQDSFNGTNLSEMQGDKNSLKIINPSEMPGHVDTVTIVSPSDVYGHGIAEITSSSLAYNSWEVISSFQSQKSNEPDKMNVWNANVAKNEFPNNPRTRRASSFSSLDMNDLSFTVLDLSSSFVDITTAMPSAIECVDNPSGDSNNSSSFEDIVNT